MSDPSRALSRVLGRGSAHEGAHHWRAQRLTALGLLILGPWLLVSLALLPDLGFETLRAWMSGLGNATLLLLLLACMAWHSQLGVQVVIEDYVKGGARMASLVVAAFLHLFVAVLGALAVLRVAFGASGGS
jgi:succinate dehydrogenase / fumarate reductase membrane anchor subunit